jgi:hypothetical protein
MSTSVLDLSTLIAPKPVYRIYNPAAREVSCDYASKTWRIPAKSTLAITDTRVRGNDKEPPVLLDARSILIALVGEDGRSGKLGELGVRPLFGDARDDLVKQEADEAHKENHYQVCLGIKLTHMSRIAKEREAGVAPTPPSLRVREAMEYVAKVERERGLTGAATCQECGWALATEADLKAHIANIHPEKAQNGFGEARPVQTMTTQAQPPVNVEAKVAQVVAARPRPQRPTR